MDRTEAYNRIKAAVRSLAQQGIPFKNIEAFTAHAVADVKRDFTPKYKHTVQITLDQAIAEIEQQTNPEQD